MMSHTAWGNLSFGFATITNLVVLFGTLSFLYWIWTHQSPLVARHHDLIELALAAGYTGYVLVLAALNTHFATPLLGLHWTALNLLVVAIFIFDLLISSPWQFAIGALETLGYAALVGARPTPLVALTLTTLIGVQAAASFVGFRFWQNRLAMLALLSLSGGAALLLAWHLGGEAADFSALLRQLLAFAVLAAGGYEYFRMLLINQLQVESRIELDELTGLKNFRTFDQDLHRRYDAARQKGPRLTLLELDIDWFKRVNDTHGHLIGNTVLQGVGRTTQDFAQALPQTANAYRLGGEEFCVAVSDLPADAVATVAKALKARLDALVFNASGLPFSITVSIGTATGSAADLHYLDVYKRADRFLYEAKRAGRDRLNIGGRIVD
ncbi:sensor domain-containing diguanylate cyclase [Lacticaseibacillus kribbianus]|uniref:GGDEF domain-containing protein n=1 Tax=Lacticaseibacillus kribbianus TaxID=2926292 RepID=UPI001CD4C2FF|nr:GGDEF domain-containing protein [Lacticaseibacillus kribbianus]